MNLRWPFQIILLCIVVLSIYYPTLNAEVSLVDDQDAIAGLFNNDSLSIKDIFVPRAKDGGYYRPLIGLGYYLDKSLWGLNIRSMHLDNIIMHLINVILVYFLTLVACRDDGEKKFNRLLPLISALLFALHPIATESVNWISGRTDPMAANFVLSAAILLIIYRNSRKTIYLVSAILMIVPAMLAKEASLGMVLAAGIILYAHKTDQAGDSNRIAEDSSWLGSIRNFLIFYSLITIEVLYIGNYWVAIVGALGYAVYLVKPWRAVQSSKTYQIKLISIVAASSAMAILLYTVLRKIAFRSDVSKISHTVKLMLEDTNYSISLFLGASGFYLKKLFLPLPLNFFILEINPLYDLIGIAVLLFCIFLITRLTLASALFIAGVCMFIPALPFAFGTIAWTGYAERYIYISSAFWIVSIVRYLDELNARYVVVGKVCRVAVPVLLLFSAGQTFNRNLVWQKNLTLLADTVEKSPKVAVIREMYMQALVNAGQYERAKEQYAIGTSRSVFTSEGPDLILAQIMVKEGKQNEALAMYESAIVKSNFKSERALRSTVSLIDRMVGDKTSNKDELLKEKKNHYESLLLKISSDPMLFYNLGQKAIGSGDKIAAIGLFEKANSLFSVGSPYKKYSVKLITRLKNEMQ
jgi:tetratricopeptide (TPR) repeat protein